MKITTLNFTSHECQTVTDAVTVWTVGAKTKNQLAFKKIHIFLKMCTAANLF